MGGNGGGEGEGGGGKGGGGTGGGGVGGGGEGGGTEGGAGHSEVSNADSPKNRLRPFATSKNVVFISTLTTNEAAFWYHSITERRRCCAVIDVAFGLSSNVPGVVAMKVTASDSVVTATSLSGASIIES